MKILLAGPGTGKTTNIKNIITAHGDGSRFLVLSFTNATVHELQKSLKDQQVTESNCMSLHKFAVKYNHDKHRHVLLPIEENELRKIAIGANIAFDLLCDFLSCTTFDQMIDRFVIYAKANPLYLKEKLAGYDSLIVDEYQDFNPHEQALIDILISTITTSYVLGDDDQCIYDFKDASADKIISFNNDSSNEKITHTHICYRCPDSVVEHATNLISQNRNRVAKEWRKSSKAGTVTHEQLNTLDDVAKSILEKIISISDDDILILTPVEFAVEPLVSLLERNGVAFTNYFEKKIPIRLIAKVWEARSIFGDHKYLNLVLLGYVKLTARKNFYECVKRHYAAGKDYDELFALLVSKLPTEIKDVTLDLPTFLQQEAYIEVFSLFQKARGESENEKLENLFKEIEQEDSERIKIMSIHKSKGLGADHVFIVGINEGILPNKTKGNDSLESQRRLFYVGMTRTKKSLTLISNLRLEGKYVNRVNKTDFRFDGKSGLWVGKSSRFISELKLL